MERYVSAAIPSSIPTRSNHRPIPHPSATLSTLHAALHGGLPPALLTAYTTTGYDSDSDSEDARVRPRSREVAQSPHVTLQTAPRNIAMARAIPAPDSPSKSHTSAGSSSTDSRVAAPTCTVVDVQRTIELRERAKSGVRRFRARDTVTRDRLFSVEARASGKACVSCNAGGPLWSILPAKGSASGRARVLNKEASPYYIVLTAQHWASHIERRALGYLHAHPSLQRSPALALEITGDALAKRFDLFGRDADNSISSLARARRSTKLATIDGAVRELTAWNVTVERNVDCAMVAAVLYVIEEWCSGDVSKALRAY